MSAQDVTTPEAAEAEDIKHAISIGPDSITMPGPLDLRIGDEVTALVRLRVTGTRERAPLHQYGKHTVTTDAAITELVELDEKVPAVQLAAAAAKVSRWRKAGTVGLFGLWIGVWADLAVLVVTR